MPRNVRNFWMHLRADGRATAEEAGPSGATGGMRGYIAQRHRGSIADTRLRIDSEWMDGTLRTWVTVDTGTTRDSGYEPGTTVELVRWDGERIPLAKGDAICLRTER